MVNGTSDGKEESPKGKGKPGDKEGGGKKG